MQGSVNGFVLAVHGGAGDAAPGRLSPQEEAAARAGLADALRAGHEILERGASALDAVELAVALLEDRAHFNAGLGSVPTSEGTIEMDAAIADGATRRVGAVACVRRLANPVRAARLVMERSPHVLLVGDGAERFALAAGAAARRELVAPQPAEEKREIELGTVGAVALDRAGHLAAATSTGGVAGQLPGRVGDSPIAGAGLWADDASCAVSATGQGEIFVRAAFAHEVDALVRLAGLEIPAACARALERVAALGGRGGCVALDRRGRLALPFLTAGMARGWIDAAGRPRVALWGSEQP
jgi:isoaspartyl peptidase/L-asparaginase-like protein (Ntn-hydrolase superfamily)